MRNRLVLPPGHRLTITVDADAPAMGVTIVAHHIDQWLGEITVEGIPEGAELQKIVDALVKRGPRSMKST